jgi:hypothetical protein
MTLLMSAAVLAVTLGLAFRLGVFDSVGRAEDEPWTIAVSSKRLDFGRVPINGSVVRQLVVRNDGPQPVRAQILVDGKSYRVSPDNLILHPGVSSRISVVAEADAPGSLTDSLRIQLEDDPSSLVIALDGEATDDPAPQAAPDPGSLPLHVEIQPDTVDEVARELVARAQRTGDAPGRVAPQFHADASRGAGPGDADGARTLVAVPNGSSRIEPVPGGADPGDAGEVSVEDRSSRTLGGLTVLPYDPATAAPFRSLAESPAATGQEITSNDAAGANEIHSRIPDAGEDGLPTTPPGDLGGDDDLFDDDLFDDDDKKPGEEPDPYQAPAFRISGLSTVRLLGAVASFYPQALPVAGSDAGGPFAVNGSFEFPQVPLAFGESMVFAQAGNPTGGFDALTGQVILQLPVQAVDSDGDAAPIVLNLTTATVVTRNESGVVVSITGSPRVSDTGMLRLVAIEKIPAGFDNGAEQHLIVVEMLASLTFSPTTNSRPGLDGFRRIGG